MIEALEVETSLITTIAINFLTVVFSLINMIQFGFKFVGEIAV